MQYHRHLLPFASVLILAASAPVADVLVVDAAGGPGSQYVDLQPAIDAAQPGDTLLVRSGTYAGFNLVSKGLSLVADQGASVTVSGSSGVRLLPAGTTALVRGLSFEAGSVLMLNDGLLEIEDCFGSVWLEECSVSSQLDLTAFPQEASSSAVWVKDSAQVIVVRSSVTAHLQVIGFGALTTPGLRVENSTVTILDSTVTAIGSSFDTVSPAGPFAIGLFGGQVYAEGSTFQGGDGADSSQVFLCQPAEDGGSAVSVIAGTFIGKGNVYIPGGPGNAMCGPEAEQGVEVYSTAQASYVELPGFVRSFEATSPVRELGLFTLSFDVQPFEDVFLLLGSEPLGLFAPGLGGSLLVWGTLQILPVGQADGSGTLDLVLPMPPLPPGVLSQDFYLQAAVLNFVGLGILGGGSVVTVLDASF